MKLSLALFILFSITTSAQNNNQCDCNSLLKETISKIETDYIAYQIAIKGKRDIEYEHHVTKFTQASKDIEIDKCVPFLQKFLEFFKDGHLFIGQNPKLDDRQKQVLQKNAELIEKTEKEIRKYLKDNKSNLDPIEGIWYAKNGSQFAIFKDKKSKKRDFVAILLSENVDSWKKGHVKAEFLKKKDGSYDVIYYNKYHYPLTINIYERGTIGGAKIRKDLILHMAPYSWGKEFPIDKSSFQKIDTSDPRAPVVILPESETVLFSIPSHVPNNAAILKKLVEKYQQQIEKSNTLIIDIRGNEGGSSWITNVLMKYIESEKKNPPKYLVNGETQVLSSEANRKYFKRLESQGWLPKNLIKRLNDNNGKVIPFKDLEAIDKKTEVKEQIAKPEELSHPQNVAILIGDGVVSAGEAFVLKAMKNQKVTLFGKPTSGVIDYQSVSISSYKNCSYLGIYFGYPMFAASKNLPVGGVNKTGIIPDVFISSKKEPIQFILNYYKK